MHVIVTGGSSGIGLEVARIYAGRGARVSLIARRIDQLQVAAASIAYKSEHIAANVTVQTADATEMSEVDAAVRACEQRFGPCDILVASAGAVDPGRFDEQDQFSFQRQIDINLLGTANSIRAVFAGMRSRREGQVMVVSSGAALIGIPGYAAYCASKSALVGLVEALTAEAWQDNVTVSICYPPDTQTPQLANELPKRPAEARALMGAAPAWSASSVARKIVRGIDRRQTKVYFGFSITMLGLFGPLLKPLVVGWFRWQARRR